MNVRAFITLLFVRWLLAATSSIGLYVAITHHSARGYAVALFGSLTVIITGNQR